ncbi:actin-related protein 8-like isoform X3 [Lotus japonicus]|uniref:actin-related protein 8-like isoform X3 n=1 Tax=Lotus japonicus TaxID=34305 RepID=UPI0025848B53|nr:actin-related protein 8-like isoform X3 [Lotus japonicus]
MIIASGFTSFRPIRLILLGILSSLLRPLWLLATLFLVLKICSSITVPSLATGPSCHSSIYMAREHKFLVLLSSMVVLVIANLAGANMLVHQGDQPHFWNLATLSHLCILGFVIFMQLFITDTESAKASRRQLKEAIYTSLFDMNVPAVCAVSQATLALYAAKRTSGIAVNIGFQVISVVPILNGKVMRKVGVEVVGLGALKLTEFLKEKMQLNNLNFQSLYTVRKLKENLCYVALDYEAELSKDTTASFEAIGDGWFTLSKERFQTGEILFQPHLAGVQAMGLHQAIALCMDRCHAANLPADSDWYKTVVLSGGTACLPGLAERIDKELNALLPPYMSNGIRVVPPPYGADTPWFGAKIIGNLSTFPGPWCVEKKLFRQKPRLNLIW